MQILDTNCPNCGVGSYSPVHQLQPTQPAVCPGCGLYHRGIDRIPNYLTTNDQENTMSDQTQQLLTDAADKERERKARKAKAERERRARTKAEAEATQQAQEASRSQGLFDARDTAVADPAAVSRQAGPDQEPGVEVMSDTEVEANNDQDATPPAADAHNEDGGKPLDEVVTGHKRSSKNSGKSKKQYTSNTESDNADQNKEDTMPAGTATRKTGTKSAGTKTKTTPKRGGKTTTKTVEADGPSKRELAAERDAELMEKVVEARESGSSWADISEELKITSGKAMFLAMKAEVAAKPKLRLKFSDDEDLAAVVQEAREAADEYSSWGWIAARTGVSEAKVKRVAEEAGVEVTGSRIASQRAAAREEAADVDTKAAKKGAAKTKGQARGRGRKADPSK